jgi:hypothetical protein
VRPLACIARFPSADGVAAMQIADRLCSSFGQDVLGAFAVHADRARGRWPWALLWHLPLAVAYLGACA